MSKEFSFEVKPESIEELKKAIKYDELNEISKRFDNGTETEDDIINHCKNYEIEFKNGNQLFVVEKKYFDKVVDLYQKEKERNTKLITQNSIRQYNDNEKIKQLKSEVGTMKEQLQMFIPRRRVRRVYKMLSKILEKTDYGLEENNGKQM